MDLTSAVRAEKLSEKDSCIICSNDLPAGERVLSGEHRVGGKWLGKTIKARACLGCAQDLKNVLDHRIREARAL